MISVEIVTLENLPSEKVEAFLLKEPKSLLYVSPSYLHLLAGFLHCEIMVLLAMDGENLIGCFPLAFKHHPTHGCVCNSLPFYGSNGGMTVLAGSDHNDEIKKALLDSAQELIIAKNCIASTIISNPLDPAVDTFLKANTEFDLLDERIGQITHLPLGNEAETAELLMKKLDDPRPRNIRKAIKEGVTIYHANTREALEFLYQVHYDNITAINGIAKEKRFFDCIPDYFNNNQYRVYIAEHNGEKIGALLLFYFNHTVEYFTPAVIETYRNLQPSALLIYQAMLDAIANGYQNWNWGGTWLSQGGVYDFKKKWGTTDYSYYYYTKIYDKQILKNPKEFFLQEYPYFFVAPFSALQ